MIPEMASLLPSRGDQPWRPQGGEGEKSPARRPSPGTALNPLDAVPQRPPVGDGRVTEAIAPQTGAVLAVWGVPNADPRQGKARSRISEVRESRASKRSYSTPTAPTTSQPTSSTASSAVQTTDRSSARRRTRGRPTRTPSAPSDSITGSVALTRRTSATSPPYEYRSPCWGRARGAARAAPHADDEPQWWPWCRLPV